MQWGKCRVLAVVMGLAVSSAVEAAGWKPVFVRRAAPGPSARESATRASKARVDAALSRFMIAHALAMRDHPITFDIELARMELTKTQNELALRTADARATLHKSAGYRRLVAADQAIDGVIALEKSFARRMAMAQQRLAIRQDLTRLEAAAIDTDDSVRAARLAVAETLQRVTQLENERQAFILKVPQLAAAKAELDAARQTLLASR